MSEADLHVVVGPQADDLSVALRHLQAVFLRHPVATLAAVQSLVAEGRSFQATEEGQQWSRRLAGSELVQRGRLVWEALSLGAFDEPPPAVLPSRLLEAAALAARDRGLEAMLAILASGGP